ncbi:MAG: hypothetical protein KDK10_11535 [Maritimibacter sp.]|nr:hypothetical protein [Maritimibacter sp.]
MLVISLTAIPPRFGQLPWVLAGLLAQGADAVALTIPRRYARFDAAPLPLLPEGVTLVETETDLGPAGKLTAAAGAFPGADLLICDDDWRYGKGWAEALRAARRPGLAVAGSTWPTERIGRKGGTVAQGFAGLLVPGDIAHRIPPPPEPAWAVDDIWISGWIAGLGGRIVEAPAARAACEPLASPGALQDRGDRAAANRDTAALIHAAFGIWPLG